MANGITDFVEAAVAVHAAAVAIVNLTPTPKDDAVLGKYSTIMAKIYRAIEVLAGVVTPLVKR